MGENRRFDDLTGLLDGDNGLPLDGDDEWLLDGYIAGLAKVDPQEAFTLAETLTDAVTSSPRHIVGEATQAGKFIETIKAVQEIGYPESEEYYRQIFIGWANAKPRDAVDYLLKAPRSAESDSHLAEVLKIWENYNPPEFDSWKNSIYGTDAYSRVKQVAK